MKMSRFLRGAMLVSGMLILSSCSVYKPSLKAPEMDNLPDDFSYEGVSEAVQDKWWLEFGDESLNGLVDSALSDNLDIGQAWARLEQSRSLARQSGASKWFSLSVDPQASRSRSSTSLGKSTNSNFILPLNISYEVDLWNRINSQAKSSVLDYEASRQDLESTALAIAGQTAAAWFSILEQKAGIELINKQIKTSEEFLELIESRFKQGLSTSVELYEQRSQVAAAKSAIPSAMSSLEITRHQLAVLLGNPPRTELPEPGVAYPEFPPFPETGVPADLLTRRPDIRAAQLRIASSDNDLAAAVADKFPTLRLSGQTGYQDSDIADIFDNWIWNLAAGLSMPLIDGGRRSAEVDRNRAVLEERILAYKETVLNAIAEVEDAITQERYQLELIEHTSKRIELYEATLEEARVQYINGLSEYINVLSTLQALQNLERNYVSQMNALFQNRISLYKALGGNWTSELKNEEQE